MMLKNMGQNREKIRTADCEKAGRVAAAMVLRSIMNTVQGRKMTMWWREEGATVKFGYKPIMWFRFMAQYNSPPFTSCIIMGLYPKGPSCSWKDESVAYLAFNTRFVIPTMTTGKCRRVIRSSHSPRDVAACGIGWHLRGRNTLYCVRIYLPMKKCHPFTKSWISYESGTKFSEDSNINPPRLINLFIDVHSLSGLINCQMPLRSSFWRCDP